MKSALRELHILFQNEFSRQCHIVLSLSNYSIFSKPKGHPVAAYVFFLVFPSLLFFLLYFLQ